MHARPLPLLSKLDLTGTNVGATLTVREIRDHLPNAVINGQLAPFTFGDKVHIAADQSDVSAPAARPGGQAPARFQPRRGGANAGLSRPYQPV
jgi:hypothetical protein